MPCGTARVWEPGWPEPPSTSGWLRSSNTGTARAAKYVNAAGNTVHTGTARVDRYAGWSGHAGTINLHASDGHYDYAICSGANAGLDMAGVADGAYRVTRQTGLALEHSRVTDPCYICGEVGHRADECDQWRTESAIRSVMCRRILWCFQAHRDNCHQHIHPRQRNLRAWIGESAESTAGSATQTVPVVSA